MSDTAPGDLYRNSSEAAEESESTGRSGRFKGVYTEIVPASEFTKPRYHQKYYRRTFRYAFYRHNCVVMRA
jgi:peptide methionine sulfoxide reductase MsrA